MAAAEQGQRIFGLSVPSEGLDLRTPTFADAAGNGNFVPGGTTAIKEGDLFFGNATREAVVAGGGAMPPGTILFEVLPDGTRRVVRTFS